MKLDETPKARSKNLDVLAEYEKKNSKNAANFVVIGMKEPNLKMFKGPNTSRTR
jgi:hypothetical protein